MVHKICGFYKLFHDYLKLFPRQEKFSIGLTIEKTLLEILEKIVGAAFAPKNEKYEMLLFASRKNDLMKYLLRLAYDLKCLNDKKYIVLEKEILEIGRLIGGWLRSFEK